MPNSKIRKVIKDTAVKCAVVTIDMNVATVGDLWIYMMNKIA